ncbi:ATP-binding protein [Halalkalibacter alkalisediminis]|uniref:histidine kinase n=2 Tax=Halalkalibacter alkalisediminis TaxID=935616 RepID=A0ABV6NGT2_9BACI
MFKSKKSIFIYLMITLLPAIGISYVLALSDMQEQEREYRNQAYKYANQHVNDIERLIGETVSRLDMLATLTNLSADHLDHIEEILTRTHEKDIRFSGFYWGNPEGDLLVGSNGLSAPINVSDRKYFQEAMKRGRYTISPAHIGRVTGRFIITIATPVFQNENISGVLFASLRIDKIEQAIKQNINGEIISVSDDIGQTLVQTSKLPFEGNVYSETIEMSILPWTITAYVIPENESFFERALLKNLVILLVLTHIVFLILHYFLLKQRIIREKEQNERHKIVLVENLAASTAHEIRNPLTGIKGLIQLLSEKYKDEKDQLYFNIILGEVNRINTIVSEMLLLGKPTAHSLATCNINDIIQEIEPIIRSEANYSSIRVSIEYSTKELPISCVKDHMKQVFLNLVKNSLDAVNSEGEVVISIDKEGDHCLIKVVDNGGGMSAQVLRQVFNPFFTMKENGTGLGLVVCKRIIESYGGKIAINSELDRGTVVELRIPLVEER